MKKSAWPGILLLMTFVAAAILRLLILLGIISIAEAIALVQMLLSVMGVIVPILIIMFVTLYFIRKKNRGE